MIGYDTFIYKNNINKKIIYKNGCILYVIYCNFSVYLL